MIDVRNTATTADMMLAFMVSFLFTGHSSRLIVGVTDWPSEDEETVVRSNSEPELLMEGVIASVDE